MTVTQVDGEDQIFLTVTQGNLSQLMQYSGSGKFEAAWFQYSPLSGVCVDVSHVYAAAWAGGLVYQQAFFAAEKNLPKPYYRFLTMRSVGSLAYDAADNLLFAADVQSGAIYALDTLAMQSHIVADGLGQVTALNFDEKAKKLYIVDGGGRQVWAIPMSGSNRKPVVILKPTEFRLPSAIVVGSDGHLWVGDPMANAIFEFSPGSQKSSAIRTIR